MALYCSASVCGRNDITQAMYVCHAEHLTWVASMAHGVCACTTTGCRAQVEASLSEQQQAAESRQWSRTYSVKHHQRRFGRLVELLFESKWYCTFTSSILSLELYDLCRNLAANCIEDRTGHIVESANQVKRNVIALHFRLHAEHNTVQEMLLFAKQHLPIEAVEHMFERYLVLLRLPISRDMRWLIMDCIYNNSDKRAQFTECGRCIWRICKPLYMRADVDAVRDGHLEALFNSLKL